MNNQQFFNSFSFVKYTYNKDRHNSACRGAAANFIGYLIKGTAKLVTKNDEVHIRAGEIVFIPKGCQYHSYWYIDEKKELEWYSLAFDVFSQPDNGKYLLQRVEPSTEGMELLHRITQNLVVNNTTLGYLYGFLGDIIPLMQRNDNPNVLLIEKAIGYMNENINLKISEIAQLCDVSESGLYGVFKKNLGMTPNQMRQKLICDRAIELLSTTDLSVEEISSELSFSSSSYFRKTLYKYTGQTPLKIRKENSF